MDRGMGNGEDEVDVDGEYVHINVLINGFI
jgi:hypothetical protein